MKYWFPILIFLCASLPNAVISGSVWFVPNPTSRDMLDLFGPADRWPGSRQLVDVFMFYRSTIDGSCIGNQSVYCAGNTLDNLAFKDAFRYLENHHIKIAMTSSVIVGGSDNENDCYGSANLRAAVSGVRNVKRYGSTVTYIDMDEPWNKALYGGFHACFAEPKISEAADVVKKFMSEIHSTFPEDGIRIGLTEPYPAGVAGGLSVGQIEAWLSALEEAGAAPAFFHLDIDMNKIRSHPDRMRADIAALNSFCRQKGIPFGVIYWGGEADTDCSYYKNAVTLIKNTKQAIGTPEHSLFMSFSRSGGPINLPESSQCTHTRLIKEGLRLLTGETH